MHESRCYSGFWMLEVEMVFLNELDHHLDLQKDDSKRSYATICTSGL
jgi:aspartyl/asparaginyl-tRNA synthetase